MGTVKGRIRGNSVGSVGLVLRGRSPRASGRKIRGMNAGGAAVSVGELKVGEDEEALPSCHLVMFVALLASGR